MHIKNTADKFYVKTCVFIMYAQYGICLRMTTSEKTCFQPGYLQYSEDLLDWADTKADLRWAHRYICWFYHAAAHICAYYYENAYSNILKISQLKREIQIFFLET